MSKRIKPFMARLFSTEKKKKKTWMDDVTKEKWLKSIQPMAFQDWLTVLNGQWGKQNEGIARILASVFAQFKISDVQKPFGLILLGAPGSIKTTYMKFFKKYTDRVHWTDDFNPASFVTHIAGRTEEKLQKIDLLPKIKNKALMVPELAPILYAQEEKLTKNLAIMTRVFDGEGFQSDSGVHGHRGYQEDFMFVFIGAIPAIKRSVWKAMGNLGHRLFMWHTPSKEPSVSSLMEEWCESGAKEKVRISEDATLSFMDWLENKEVVEWNRREENMEVLKKIIMLAQLLTYLRSEFFVHTETVEDEMGHAKQAAFYSRPTKEMPYRPRDYLIDIARGHAIVNGRAHLSEVDIPLIVKLVLDSAPEDRSKAFLLLARQDELTSSDLQEHFHMSQSNAYRTIITLQKIGIAESDLAEAETVGGLQVMRVARLLNRWKPHASIVLNNMTYVKGILSSGGIDRQTKMKGTLLA